MDDPQTLARAAQVSRYWNTLLQDETTWRDFLLARHRIGISVSHRNDQPQDPNATNYNTNNNRWGTLTRRRENSLGIGTGNNQACCIKRVTPFGLEKRVLNLSSGLTGLPPQSLSTPSTYKTRVKLAYLTETNWLTAGVLLAKHLSADDSVVTTLSFDESWIVVGMANSKIHVFSAVNGAWKRSLEGRAGHTQGVWAMVLVSPLVNPIPLRPERCGAQASTASTASASASASASTPLSNGWFGFISHPHHETATETEAYTQDERENQTGKTAEEDEDEREGGNLCGSVRGWQGLKTSLVVSGGCDKQVKVWDVETGYVSDVQTAG